MREWLNWELWGGQVTPDKISLKLFLALHHHHRYQCSATISRTKSMCFFATSNHIFLDPMFDQIIRYNILNVSICNVQNPHKFLAQKNLSTSSTIFLCVTNCASWSVHFISTDKKRLFEEDQSPTFYNWHKILQMCHFLQLCQILQMCHLLQLAQNTACKCVKISRWSNP